MFKKITNINQPKKEQFFLSKSYEEDREYLYKKSARTAWIIAGICVFLLVIVFCSFCFLLPLKEVKPYVIQTNKETGIPEVITVVNPQKLQANEALDKYFINHYVNLRESYTYQTIQKTYTETQIYNNNKVNNDYLSFMNKEPTIDKVIKDGTINIKVKSIVLDESAGLTVATIRIDKTVKLENNAQSETKPYIIRLSYEYNPQTKMKLEYRMDNPLGFTITSYQIVEEVS